MNAHPDIVAIGASSGGLEALQSLLAAPCDLDAIVLVVLHRPANRTSFLREILVRKSRMPVVIARHGELLHHGVCYIAEPSQHLMVGLGLRADLLPDHRYTTRNIDQLFISLRGIAVQGPSAWCFQGSSTTERAGSRPSRKPAELPWSRARTKPHIRKCLATRSHMMGRSIWSRRFPISPRRLPG